MSEPPSKRTYSQEEVTEILKRAMKQQNLQKQGLSHDELVEMANEVGIDRSALDSATAELVQSQAQEMARMDDARALAEERTRLFSSFVSQFFFYVVICGALYFIDTKFTGGTWYYWPAFGWGIAILFQLHAVMFPQRSLERRRAREQRRALKAERRAMRQERTRRLRLAFGLDGHEELHRLKGERRHQGEGVHEAQVQERLREAEREAQAAVNAGAREFETAVQAGVAALLNVAARKIQEHASRTGEPHRSDPYKRRR
ncbi:MAG: 2TM domain-containing protein [Polyangiaceae bacterium]